MSPVASYQELMDEQARAAVKVTGAHHSSWSKEIRRLPAGVDRAKAKWDGAIAYRDDVTATLREMFDNAGRTPSDADLARYRDAVGVVLHENIHLLAARGTSHGMGYEAFQRGGVQVLEEGVTEAYKVRVLNAYIAELGLERIAPMISKAEPFTAYPQFVPAAEVFANAIARRTQVDEKRELSRPSGPDGQGEPGPRGALDGQEVLRRLAVVNAEDKFRVAAELVYEASDLPELVPKSHRDQAIERIMGSMMQPFDRIEDFAADDASDIAMSPLAGSEADRKGYRQVRVLTRFWLARQDLRKSLDLGITGSPRLTAPARPGSATAQGQDSGGVPPTGGRRLSRRDQINCRPVERND